MCLVADGRYARLRPSATVCDRLGHNAVRLDEPPGQPRSMKKPVPMGVPFMSITATRVSSSSLRK